ncbi:MAG: RNA methyltransferase, partial [Verrucomicrobiota bacterium]
MKDSNEIVVEGGLAVGALIDSGRFDIRSVYVEECRHLEIVARARSAGLPVTVMAPAEIRKQAGYDFHRGIIAKAARPAMESKGTAWLESASRLVLPIGLADPGNLGTVFRSAAAFGSDAILVEANRGADIWNRKAIRASATAVFRLPVIELANTLEFLDAAKQAGFEVYGTSLSPRSEPLRGTASVGKSLILLGA